jgi:DNA-binding transcriptional ArsR family regulator
LARFNFTPDDVARTRFSPAAAPVLETILLMAELRGLSAAASEGRRRADQWVREARAAFPATARPLLDLLRPCMPWPDFLDSFAPDLKEGLEEVRSTPRAVLRAQLSYDWRNRPGRPPTWIRELADGDRESLELVVRAVHDLHHAAVEPRWDGAMIAFHAELARRIPVLAARGHEGLFETLHPRLRWRENGLDRTGFDGEWELNGQGMVLMPSAFWTGAPLFSISDDRLRPHVLIYAARPRGPRDPRGIKDPRAANGHGPDATGHGHGHGPDDGADAADADGLAALLGPTRAAVLRALTAPRGTAELAGVVGISPASASEHAKVLREVYLIETLRHGRAVRHSLTPLGRTMLGQLHAAADWPQ